MYIYIYIYIYMHTRLRTSHTRARTVEDHGVEKPGALHFVHVCMHIYIYIYVSYDVCIYIYIYICVYIYIYHIYIYTHIIYIYSSLVGSGRTIEFPGSRSVNWAQGAVYAMQGSRHNLRNMQMPHDSLSCYGTAKPITIVHTVYWHA